MFCLARVSYVFRYRANRSVATYLLFVAQYIGHVRFVDVKETTQVYQYYGILMPAPACLMNLGLAIR